MAREETPVLTTISDYQDLLKSKKAVERYKQKFTDLKRAVKRVRKEIEKEKKSTEDELIQEDVDQGIIIGLQMALDLFDKFID